MIILTDGLWQGMLNEHAVDQKIIEFTQQLAKINGDSLRERTVSIEFVQFGNDAHATERLQCLDHDLSSFGIPKVHLVLKSRDQCWSTPSPWHVT